MLRRAEQGFAEPRYLHLIRHPGAMIRSFEEAKLDQTFFRAPHGFARRELAELIWLVCEQNIARFLAEVDPRRQHAVRFEDLVRDPEAVLGGICDFLGVDYHPAMADPYQQSRERMTDGLHAESRMLGDVKFHQHRAVDAAVAEQWREHLSEDDLGDLTWSLAATLGYAKRAAPARSDHADHSDHSGRSLHSSLVRLRDGAGAPPLFLVHPVGGNVLCYAQLAQRLGGAIGAGVGVGAGVGAAIGAVYGLQSAGLAAATDGGPGAAPQETVETVEEMARHYLAAIREVQPHGPYRLAGWSMGGLVAFEMARRLEQAGESIDLLALVDSAAPGPALSAPADQPEEAELLFGLARDLAGLAGQDEAWEREWLAGLDPAADVAALVRRAEEVGALPPGLEAAEVDRLWQVFRANATAARRYVPGPYNGKTWLVASARNPYRDLAGADLGWSRWAGNVEAEILDVDHYDLLREPAVGELAAGLRARLAVVSTPAEADAEAGSVSFSLGNMT